MPTLRGRRRTGSGIGGRCLALFLLAALVTALCYAPGLWGPFLFDDEPNITQNTAVQVQSPSVEKLILAARSYGDQSFQRALSMLSFALNHLLTGLDPFWLKLTNLLIHLTNGWLVFLLARLWLQALQPLEPAGDPPGWIEWTPLAVAAAWMLHPLNLTSVLYVVQRMTSLGALFALGGMILYMAGRLRLRAGQSQGLLLMALGLFGGTLLAYGAKENGVLLPLYLLVTEWILFRFADPRPGIRWTLRLSFLLLVGLPALMVLGFLVLHPDWLPSAYGGRSFTLFERALTQPRVIWFYLKLLLVPSGQDLSLYHDDIPVSTGWAEPWTTLPAILALAALLTAAIGLRRRLPAFAFGVLVFLAGHALESTLLPLEMAHEHRNYLPILGILFAASYYLLRWPRRLGPVPIGVAFALPFILLYAVVTLDRSRLWSNLYDLTSTEAEQHPGSTRWQHELGRAFWIASTLTEDPARGAELAELARKHFLAAAALSPPGVGDLVAVLHVDSALDVAPDPPALARLQESLGRELLSPFAVSSFLNWLTCLGSAICRAAPETVETLISALLGNPRLSDDSRGKLLASAAQWAINEGRIDAALDYARRAAALAPREMQHHLNLIAVLTHGGMRSEAAERLASVKGRGDAYLYADKIQAADQSLREADAHAGAGLKDADKP